MAFDAVVVAGGAGSRMGSARTDKAMLEVGDVTLLDRVLAAVTGAEHIVIVGPRRPIAMTTSAEASVSFTTEEPPGGGPAAAVVHGLEFVTAPLVVVLAADVPFAATAVPRLIAAITARAGAGAEASAGAAADAAMIVDPAGRRQSLLAIYRTEALRRAVAGDRWIGRSVRALTGGLRVCEVPAVGAEALDCDTPEELATARSLAPATRSTRAGPMSPPAG